MHTAGFYSITLFSGLFYYVLLSAVAAGGVGLNPQTAVPIVAALLLGGIGPGLTIVAPRAAVWFVGSLSLFFVGYILIVVIGPPADAWALVAGIPAAASLLAALFASRRDARSAWHRSMSRTRRISLFVASVVPLLPASVLVVGIAVAL